MNVIRKRLDELKRPERNVRMHTDKQLHEFRRSVEMFGQIRPIVIDESNVILAGNGLHETLCSMGHSEADCYVVSGLTEAEKKKLMLADNRVFDLGVDDLSVFDSFILELKDDLDIPGFEEDLLRSIVMDTDAAGDTLREYGTIDDARVENIKETGQRYEAMEEAAAKQSEEVAPAPPPKAQDIQSDPTHKYIICPKCGERIWL